MRRLLALRGERAHGGGALRVPAGLPVGGRPALPQPLPTEAQPLPGGAMPGDPRPRGGVQVRTSHLERFSEALEEERLEGHQLFLWGP